MIKRKKVYIIAEIGPNHNGSFKTAKKMVKYLKNSGADAIKFQLGTPDEVYSQDAFMAEYQKKNTKYIHTTIYMIVSSLRTLNTSSKK